MSFDITVITRIIIIEGVYKSEKEKKGKMKYGVIDVATSYPREGGGWRQVSGKHCSRCCPRRRRSSVRSGLGGCY